MENLHLHNKVNITKTIFGKLVMSFSLHVCGLICIFIKFIFINYIKKLHKNIVMTKCKMKVTHYKPNING
jgi:hypothetical protein